MLILSNFLNIIIIENYLRILKESIYLKRKFNDLLYKYPTYFPRESFNIEKNINSLSLKFIIN